MDNVDGDISASIVTSSNVNTSLVGTYSVTYNVSDIAGNAATQVTRTVIVTLDATPPASNSSGSSGGGIGLFVLLLMLGLRRLGVRSK